MLLGGKSSSSNPFPTSLLEATLQQRQRSLQQRLRSSSNPTIGNNNNNNNNWERETVRGINHSFGMYKLCVPTYTTNDSCGWTEEEVVIQEECSTIATRVWDNSTLTVKWLQRRLDEEHLTLLQQQNQNTMISTPETLASVLDWDNTALTNNAASSPRHRPIQVLELGSGMGLLSIALAKIGAAVMATEYGSENVKHLQKNCKNNGVLTTDTTTIKTTTTIDASSNMLRPGRVYCRELDWYTTQETIDSLNVGAFDLIVVTDCSLSQKDSDGVMDMILRYGTPGETKAIVGLCKEREGTPHFVERAQNEFRSVRNVSETEYHPDYRSKRHTVLLIDV
mmetsp:Transcript_59783/g.146802  ORF Transcript_59783/g.146802 Transcript_59783/m.146802 type:complete len:337 (-) Transcript_59783:4302-5312(-)|eukprot:CAMPEP_0113516962 /NCGR_PEP_ID=MMETSP0014_2-20120614/41928_1 /TAXON_ID=2857 /ORGANISM="Nitzschia sp." /LENGTH=336 /DNA_ID=CAMNT_0000413973 /DNA_START=313 /DNA_END=1323 /DNA_ORIENTATION=- /assembly_acc=CAM_ASM_000159